MANPEKQNKHKNKAIDAGNQWKWKKNEKNKNKIKEKKPN